MAAGADRFFPGGVQCLSAAVAADHARDYEEALRLYIRSFEFFLTGLKCTFLKNL